MPNPVMYSTETAQGVARPTMSSDETVQGVAPPTPRRPVPKSPADLPNLMDEPKHGRCNDILGRCQQPPRHSQDGVLMKLLSSLALFLSFSALAQPGFADGTYFRPERVGSKPRPTMDKIADTVNVKDFGAKCDWNGTTGTDDHVALQNALNAATSASPNTTLNAINLVISGPCYIGTTGLTVPSSKALFIRGEGSGSIVYAGGPGTVGFRVGDGNGIAQWIDIQGLTFDCINVTG